MAKKWYVIHTHSGFEHRVKAALEERIKTNGLEEKIDSILLPVEEITEVRKGKKQIAKKKFLPGYLFPRLFPDRHILSHRFYARDYAYGVLGAAGYPLCDHHTGNIPYRRRVGRTLALWRDVDWTGNSVYGGRCTLFQEEIGMM